MKILCGSAKKRGITIEFFRLNTKDSQNLRDFKSWLKDLNLYDRIVSEIDTGVIILSGRYYFTVTEKEFNHQYKIC